MTARRRKSTVYVCLIRPAWACPLWQLAKWECKARNVRQWPAKSLSAFSFQWLQRSGYVFGRSDWCYSTEDMPRMCLCLASAFSVSYRF